MITPKEELRRAEFVKAVVLPTPPQTSFLIIFGGTHSIVFPQPDKREP